MKTIVYEPTDLAYIFTLDEALRYVADGSLFREVDPTEHLEELFEYSRQIITLRELNEFAQGSEQNSNFTVFKSHDYPENSSPEEVERYIQDMENGMLATQEKELEELSTYKAELFLALKKGKVTAYGKRINAIRRPRKSWLADDGWEDFDESEINDTTIKIYQTEEVISGKILGNYQAIDKDFWVAEGIDWELSQAKSPRHWFTNIFLVFDNLKLAFPLPYQTTKQVESFGEYIISSSELDGTGTSFRKKREPKYDWPSFQAEIARYAVSVNGILPKQEALIAHMQQWCKDNKWEKTPSYGSMQPQIKPHYKKVKKPPSKLC
jgi:hypothetical protein